MLVAPNYVAGKTMEDLRQATVIFSNKIVCKNTFPNDAELYEIAKEGRKVLLLVASEVENLSYIQRINLADGTLRMLKEYEIESAADTNWVTKGWCGKLKE